MKKLKAKSETIPDSYDYLANSASSTDCTGLIPAAPISEAELESYNETYHYIPPVVKSKISDSKIHSK